MPETSVFLTTKPGDAWRKIEQTKPDILLLEWADSLCAAILRHKKPNCKVVVRLHDHEVTRHDQIAKNVNWRNVDSVWFINRNIEKQFKRSINNRVPTFFLPNAVDPANFALSQKTEKKAGLMSLYFRPRKAIYRVAMLARACPDWSFHVRVQIPKVSNMEFRPEYDRVKEIAGNITNLHIEDRAVGPVVWDNYPFEDVNEFWQDKAVVLSTSKHEGFHYNISEGALTGAMPIVWNWPTSKDFWEPYVIDSVNKAAKRLNEWQPGKEKEHRAYIEDNYSPTVLLPQLLEKLKTL